MKAKFNLENFTHWIWALTWSYFAALNIANASMCRAEEKWGLFILACAGGAFSIVNAMTSFREIGLNDKREPDDERAEEKK